MKKLSTLIAVFAGIVALIGSTGYADQRRYVWTYEYATMPPGVAEIEYYLTMELPDKNESKVNKWKHWVEFEYGLTDHLDLSLYQMWKQSNSENKSTFEYDGFKIRGRYRFGEKGSFLVDPLLYLEYKRNDDLSQPNIMEAKAILARDIGDLNISYNQILDEIPLASQGKPEHKYAAGISYRIASAFGLGLESTGNYSKDKYAAGPTLSFVADSFWLSLGMALGLNNRTDDIQTRMIAGFSF